MAPSDQISVSNMERLPLHLTIISAEDINDINLFSKMDVYAIVTLSNDPRSKQETPVDRDGGKNPTWNFDMKFSVLDLPHRPLPVLYIQLRSDRSLGDRDIGEVHVPIKELLDKAASFMGEGVSGPHFVSYQVRKPSGKPKGLLNFSFKFGEKIETVTAYPAAAGPIGYPPLGDAYSLATPSPGETYLLAPPPPVGYAYGGRPPPAPAGYGYGYPPPPPGLGYFPPPMVAPPQQPRKNKFGMGLAAGILGRAIGGCFTGDMISDSIDA